LSTNVCVIKNKRSWAINVCCTDGFTFLMNWWSYRSGNVSLIHRRANTQVVIKRDFQGRWRHEYITSFREYHHKVSGDNIQLVRKGDVLLVDDDVPHTTWKMAVIEDLIIGQGGLTWAATIRTINGMINRFITKLYPLEITARVEDQGWQPFPGTEQTVVSTTTDQNQMNSESGGTRKAVEKLKDLARIFGAFPSPEDVATAKL